VPTHFGGEAKVKIILAQLARCLARKKDENLPNSGSTDDRQACINRVRRFFMFFSCRASSTICAHLRAPALQLIKLIRQNLHGGNYCASDLLSRIKHFHNT
jgi:hypothetical protein